MKAFYYILLIDLILVGPITADSGSTSRHTGFRQFSIMASYINPTGLNRHSRDILNTHAIQASPPSIHYGGKLRYDYCPWRIHSRWNTGISLEGIYYMSNVNFPPSQNYSGLSTDMGAVLIGPALYYEVIRHSDYIIRAGLISELGLIHYAYQLIPSRSLSKIGSIVQIDVPVQVAIASSDRFRLMLDGGFHLFFSRDVRIDLAYPSPKTGLNAHGFYIGLSLSTY
ncbi:MAG: hypothetical protein KBA26_03945 [Candidatus Delongbacteria bacterium]|nr:hypothetical protein [Candidatus Delongbacteria bacterium]